MNNFKLFIIKYFVCVFIIVLIANRLCRLIIIHEVILNEFFTLSIRASFGNSLSVS